ncbi:MAG: imidazole glycerol phosphate synthase subunit HisF [Anaerolineae bacterium]|nr:imidazole glycerol phosphate synthase subunit HisF [Anaerolineae bacterium]
MLMTRVMPCLLLRDGALVKTVKFKDPGYIGDPINAVRIYNEKEVDELIFLDITATVENKTPPFKVLSEIASECFMPVAYGGGVRDLADIKTIFKLGIEKVAVNSYAVENPTFIREAADTFGSQSIMVAIDAKQVSPGHYEIYTRGGRRATGLDPISFAARMQEMGAGELLLTSIDRDGTQTGYDIDLIKQVTSVVDIPVIACGGAGKVSDFGQAVRAGGASACAAGSMVVYFGRNRAVLINFPKRKQLEEELG